MIESPLLKEIAEEAAARAKRQDVLSVLESTFELPQDVVNAVNQIEDLPLLGKLVVAAARCKDLSEFRKQLPVQGLEASE